MYKQKLIRWIISIIFIAFVFSFIIVITDPITASAQSYENQTSDPYIEESQSEKVNFPASLSSSDKDIYKRLGKSRLSEGEEGLTEIHYIENTDYFLANPKHRENYTSTGDHVFGTCTTVAHQILLGYHNYYSDRRLIPQFGSDGTQYLSDDYGDLNEHPKVQPGTTNGLGRTSIGTTDDMFFEIFNLSGGEDLLSQVIGNVASASNTFLLNCAYGREKNWTITKGSYNKSHVISELDAGRPVILGFSLLETGSAHVVVAYGYATYNGGELCYLTHYGWDSDDVQMLVPASWLSYQVVMSVNHTHEYIDMEKTYYDANNVSYRAMKCKTCGCTTLDEKYVSSLFAGGTGTLADPFLISTEEQFRAIGVAHRPVYVWGQGYENQIDYAFKLINNLTISVGWTPFTYKFSGDFDGGGLYISYKMTLTKEDINASSYHGLFGFVVNGGKIHDLELMNCSITSDTSITLSRSDDNINIGIVAGAFYKSLPLTNITVTNPTIECKINNASIGAIAGSFFYTTATNCVVRKQNKTSSITNNTRGYLGGMAGIGDGVSAFSGCAVTITLTNTSFDSDKDMMGKVIGNVTLSDDDDYFNIYDITVNVTLDTGKCLASGTLITLADGSQVPVEQLTGNEMLLVWNLYTGQFDIAPILFIDTENEAEYEVINLTFSDGTVVKVIGEHGFWDFDLNKYVYLDENAAQYIGHSFNKQSQDGWTSVQLIDVCISTEVTIAWSPVTYGHLCYYVNGMLSMPGGIDGLFNIFEVDAETMRYDEALMQADIETYGLYTYEEFAELVPVSEEVFEAFNGTYLKVAIGKGLIDIPTLQQLANRYAEFFGEI